MQYIAHSCYFHAIYFLEPKIYIFAVQYGIYCTGGAFDMPMKQDTCAILPLIVLCMIHLLNNKTAKESLLKSSSFCAAWWNVLLEVLLLQLLRSPLNFSPITMQASLLSEEQPSQLHCNPFCLGTFYPTFNGMFYSRFYSSSFSGLPWTFHHYHASFSPVRGTAYTVAFQPFLSWIHSISLSISLFTAVCFPIHWRLPTWLVILSSYIVNHLHPVVIAFMIYNSLLPSLSINRWWWGVAATCKTTYATFTYNVHSSLVTPHDSLIFSNHSSQRLAPQCSTFF